MITRRAECSCGQLSAICSGEPIRIAVCHCLACKRHSGSAFSFNARFAEENVSIQDERPNTRGLAIRAAASPTVFVPIAGPPFITDLILDRVWSSSQWAHSPTFRSHRPPCRSITRAEPLETQG